MSKQSSKQTPNTLDQSLITQVPQPKSQTVIQRATQIVDSVTNMLCKQITEGTIIVPQQQKQLESSIRVERQSKVNLQIKTIDIDEHKRMVKKFMLQNKSIRKKRQLRSFQMSQKSLKIEKQREESKVIERSQIIEDRKKLIQKRMEAKKALLSEIRKSSIQSTQRVKVLRKKKFLYEDKEEQFYKNFILPKIEEQKKVLERKKQLRRPMDLSQIIQHEKQYEELRINEQLNRSITRKMLEDQRKYSPPQFIPTSYRLSEKQQKLKREEQYMKKRENQINQIRKKQYIRAIEEIRQKERQLSRSRSPKGKESKQKVKQQKSREQTKKMGNDYLKQLLESKKKFITTKKMIKLNTIPESPKRKIKSQYEIEIIREERIEKVHKIKARKIDGIVHDKSLDNFSKYERLKHETERLDEEAYEKLKESENIQNINESASIMVNSIHAKIAMLAFNSTKKF